MTLKGTTLIKIMKEYMFTLNK
ncbi:hypothetical protein TSAR_005782 [Trichomalopsis sarcophagae]|uniref:Uncharacterized protein n=1 Tax=Trichomalopsis sarcophagae TaxID=543379 RepID=A0A232EMD1_9HYME|nr:hypothetical protein TSAR_005782 [Trichomalopsis sarcophagae]